MRVLLLAVLCSGCAALPRVLQVVRAVCVVVDATTPACDAVPPEAQVCR